MKPTTLAAIAVVLISASVVLPAPPARAIEVTSIRGTFNGCDWDKTYGLLNGRTLICRCYRYHYAYAPKVVIIDSSTVLIDDEEYSAWTH